MRVGLGFDVHPFAGAEGNRLVLGGVVIAGAGGLRGHSDADVVAHAVADAVLGASGQGDLGRHFPDTDARWKGADSLMLLERVGVLCTEAGWRVINVDCTVVLETPAIAAHLPVMEQRLTGAIGAPVSVHAKRAEGLGAVGRAEGVACWAVALVEPR